MNDPKQLPQRELRARLEALQKQAFSIFEQAAENAQSEPTRADAIYLHAEKQARPLITEGDELRREWVRRARRRARIAWLGAGIAALVFSALIIFR